MNNEQKELLDEAYENFEKQCIPGTGKKMSKEEFIEFIKTNNEFSNHWGLKIEERELSLEERYELMKNGISEEKAYQEALDYVEILEDKAYNNLKHFLSGLFAGL
jgi:hypothetical protein